MKITNRLGLPVEFVKACEADLRALSEPSRLSVTRLVDSPYLARLFRERWDDIETDASEMVWAILGKAIHGVFDAGGGHTEMKLEVEHMGVTIVGVIDHYDEATATVTDYKIVSAWSVLDGVKPEWERQLNVYAWMLRRIGRPVQSLRIVSVYRDWSRSEAERDALKAAEPGGLPARYPAHAVDVMAVRLWAPDEAEAYVAERIRLHTAETPQECTPEERWRRPTKWAVYRKSGDARAFRVFSTQEEADTVASQIGGIVKRRDGEDVRCESYCLVRDFCQIRRRA